MSRNPYEVFAQVYDQDVQLEIPRAFFRTLRPLIEARREGPPILDLGCGSGLLTERIARTGARVLGIDGSRPMLVRARARCAPHGRRVVLRHARLERLRVAERARLAFACQDVVNHLPSRAALRRVCARVARALLPGGLFAFDSITRYCFETYWTDNTHLLEGPHGDVVMSCDWDEVRERGTARIVRYARAERGRFTRADTRLHEYFHADEELAGAMAAAGFAQVWSRPWSPWRFQDREAQRHRRMWCGVMPGAEARIGARLRGLRFGRVV